MLNKVILIGRLTSDIEIRHSNDQMPYTYFTIAVNRQGSKDKTDFISCVAFRSTAELMSRYLSKGSLISVEGRLEVYRSESAGEYQTRTNVVVNNVVFLETRRNSNASKNDDMMTFASNDSNIQQSDSRFENNQTSISNDNTEEEFDFDNFELKI